VVCNGERRGSFGFVATEAAAIGDRRRELLDAVCDWVYYLRGRRRRGNVLRGSERSGGEEADRVCV